MKERSVIFLVMVLVGTVFFSEDARAVFEVGPEELVTAGGSDIGVSSYSVPSYVDFNGDGLNDLVVGEGPAGGYGKVRVYLNGGTVTAPSFSNYFYVQSGASDLTVPASGCLGIFPRLVYWDSDSRKDLLVGQYDGKVKIYLNTNTDSDPVFDTGTYLTTGTGSLINLSARATPSVVDWNNDGRKDLIAGGISGTVQLFVNEGSDTAPYFASPIVIASIGSVGRSSPAVADMDGDGRKDLIVGDTSGRLSFFGNVGTDDSPMFDIASLIQSEGSIIDLYGSARSRPFICDWTNDGNLDILVGAGDGKIHLFQGVPEPATILLMGIGAIILRRKR